MTDNLDFGMAADATQTLAVLRAMTLGQDIASGERFVPGLFLAIDGASDTKARIESQPGMLLDLECKTRRPGGFLSLNLELGECDLSRYNVLGIMCKSVAPETLTFRACLRSGTEDGFVDAFFAKRVISFAQESVHADLMKLAEREDIPAQAPWRELILFLPPDLHRLSLRDFALFGV